MLKITRLDTQQREVETLIDLGKITCIKEKLSRPTSLFNEDGELVETKENPSVYELQFDNGHSVYITFETYEKLVKKLKIENLE